MYRTTIAALAAAALLAGCGGSPIPGPATPVSDAAQSPKVKPAVAGVSLATYAWVVDGASLKKYSATANTSSPLAVYSFPTNVGAPLGKIAVVPNGGGETVYYVDGLNGVLANCSISSPTSGACTYGGGVGNAAALKSSGPAPDLVYANGDLVILNSQNEELSVFNATPFGEFQGTLHFAPKLSLPIKIAVDPLTSDLWIDSATNGKAELMNPVNGSVIMSVAVSGLPGDVDVNENEQMWTGNIQGTIAEMNLISLASGSYEPGSGYFSQLYSLTGIASDKLSVYAVGHNGSGRGEVEIYADNAPSETAPERTIADPHLANPTAITLQ